jgi:hypothetical protein
MKNAVFWDVASCGFIAHRRFGWTCRLHLQGRRNTARKEKCKTVANRLATVRSHWLKLGRGEVGCGISSTLKMEATCSSETSVYNKPTRSQIPKRRYCSKWILIHQLRTGAEIQHSVCVYERSILTRSVLATNWEAASRSATDEFLQNYTRHNSSITGWRSSPSVPNLSLFNSVHTTQSDHSN